MSLRRQGNELGGKSPAGGVSVDMSEGRRETEALQSCSSEGSGDWGKYARGAADVRPPGFRARSSPLADANNHDMNSVHTSASVALTNIAHRACV